MIELRLEDEEGGELYEKLSRQVCIGVVLRFVDALGERLRGHDSQVLSDDERLAVAAVNAVNSEARIRELEETRKRIDECRRKDYVVILGLQRQLKTMTEDSDEYRDRLLRTTEPKFFLVWNPSGSTPPRYKHLTHVGAKDEALRLATLHPDQSFYVVAEAGHAAASSVQSWCDQGQFDEEIPF